MTENKLNSPHPALQTVLSQLGRLSVRRGTTPIFSSRDAAEHVIAISATATGRDVALTGVWTIDHEDLTSSEIVAWTVTSMVN